MVVRKHWLRAGYQGIIVDCQPLRRNIWLVLFDFNFVGGGMDGDKLFMDTDDMILINPAPALAMAVAA